MFVLLLLRLVSLLVNPINHPDKYFIRIPDRKTYMVITISNAACLTVELDRFGCWSGPCCAKCCKMWITPHFSPHRTWLLNRKCPLRCQSSSEQSISGQKTLYNNNYLSVITYIYIKVKPRVPVTQFVTVYKHFQLLCIEWIIEWLVLEGTRRIIRF